jgi:hypothetical protein
MVIALASKPGITGANTLSIPKDWDQVWFRHFINNQLKGADVRNAVGSNGVTVTGTIASPYGTITLNFTTSGTATAGAATLPANPVGFIVLSIGGVSRKIPYYAT